MNFLLKNYGKLLLALCMFFWSTDVEGAIKQLRETDTTSTSSREEAIKFIDGIKVPELSVYWPNINPVSFLQNIKENIHEPLGMYPGIGTNFCGYGALIYLFLHDDPLGYAKFMLALYKDGKASLGISTFEPAEIIKQTAGTLKYKGLLDIRPAEQMFYLTLADHFKGYVNIFNRHFDPGDENTFWASVNYAKFNRMVRHLLNYKVYARGTDLLQPSVGNTYDYIRRKMQQGIVVLYLNNRILHKKKQEKIKLGIPTHFVILQDIMKTKEGITLIYWDYGHKTLRQLKPQFLHKIVFGVSQCIKKKAIEK
ncbi:MAG: hypothetical protein ABI741_12265 [Ferruginibacter sp.]